MDIFGDVHVLPLNLSDDSDQFQIYRFLSLNFKHSFLFESLVGPKNLAEMSIMGFNPTVIFKGYRDRVEITMHNDEDDEQHNVRDGDNNNNCTDNCRRVDTTSTVINVDDPFKLLRFLLRNFATQPDILDLEKLYVDYYNTPHPHTNYNMNSNNDNNNNNNNNNDHYTDNPNDICNDDTCKNNDAAHSLPMCNYRYVGGAVGMVNYDAIRIIENIPDSNDSSPLLMEFGIYNDGILYDNKLQKPFYFYRGTNKLDYLMNVYENFRKNDYLNEQFHASNTTPNIDKSTFSKMVNKAKEYIHNGDIFQVVLSRRFDFDTSGDTLVLYDALRDINPSPYMYHLKHDDHVTIGASPEMLIRITGNVVETFPIAGTRKITGIKSSDDALAQELLADKKELAEHTMLVDLGRNDIGRVCKFGTVYPKSLLKIKQFSHVQHIVTHLMGTLDDGNDMFDTFQAVFPAGTVSGAPKVRAMEIIDELESNARGPYAGAVGYFSYNGCCDFAIAIRSIFINGKKGFVQSGAGIVYDSVPEYEFNETEHKANALLLALKEASKK